MLIEQGRCGNNTLMGKLSTLFNLISSVFYEMNDEKTEIVTDEPYEGYIAAQDNACESIENPPVNPLINIILCNYKKADNESVESVLAQSYTNWELYIPNCEYVFSDDRIHSIGDMSAEQLNEILYGDFAVILESGDRLKNYALKVFVDYLCKGERADAYYADNDEIRGNRAVLPYFKPKFSPDTLLSVNYIGRPFFVSMKLFRSAGGIKSFNQWDEYVYTLNVCSNTDYIKRIDKVLLTKSSDNSYENPQIALNNIIRQEGIEGYAVGGLYKGSCRVHYYINEKKRVQIIIYGSENAEKLRDWVEYTRDISINPSITIAGRENDDYELKRYQTALSNSDTARVIRFDGSCSFAEMMNRCVKDVQADAYVFCSCECIPFVSDWIDAMYELAQNDRAGTVSPLILSPDSRIMGAGNVAGLKGTWGVPYFGEQRKYSDKRMNFYINTIRDVSIADMNVFMISDEAFSAMRGFDTSFHGRAAIADLSIRLLRAGYRNVYTPYSCLQGIPKEFNAPDERDKVRTYDTMREILIQSDRYYSKVYDLSSAVPRVLEYHSSSSDEKGSSPSG